MAKSGRPRKSGERYENGRLTRQARTVNAAQEAEDAMQTVTEARMRQYLCTKSQARHPDMGFPLGRLLKKGYISKAQYEAGNKFTDAMRAYLSSKGVGLPDPSAQDIDPDHRGASLVQRPVRRQDEARDYMEALAEVDAQQAGTTATSLVWNVCLREQSGRMNQKEMGRMREGLNAVDRAIKRRERMAKRAA